jgi:hypothetical protein
VNPKEQRMENSQPSFVTLAAKTMACHTITYVIIGILAAHFLDYGARFAQPDSGMRQITDPWVMAGPLFQPLRGLVFASVFYPFRETLFGKKNGWLLMAWMLLGLGILSTFAAASGSIEGMIYSARLPQYQVIGWLEVMPQAVLFSGLLCFWVNRPGKKWLNWTLGISFFMVMALPLLGLLTRKG